MAKRKNYSKGKPVRRHRRKGVRLQLKPETVFSIAQIVFFSLAALSVVSFSRQGKILIRLNDLLLALFSWTSIFIPAVLFTVGFMISRFKVPFAQPNVVVGSLLVFLSLAGLSKAGSVGLAMFNGVATLLTPAGSFIVFSAGVLVGFIVLFNTSLNHVLGLLSKMLRSSRKFVVGDGRVGKTDRMRLSFPSKNEAIKVVGADNQNSRPSTDKVDAHTKPNTGPILPSNVGAADVWEYPPMSLLSDTGAGKVDRGDINDNAATIEKTLESFGITSKVKEVNLGPAVTQYALEVALGTKLSRITALERDLALALAAPTGTIRIEAPIPGRSLVGIELPNRSPEFVPLKKVMVSDAMKAAKSKITVALGLDVAGKPVVTNLGKMPHVLIAGQTGSGKSVAINSFLASILMRASPSEVKFILVDPKRVELTGYNNIPHLLAPVIVEPEKVISALRWIMNEMDRRYKMFAEVNVRNIDAFNELAAFQSLPYIVLIIDELADIMLFSPAEVEDCITRIAQMSRATGIHMILATQRPSVDVITGLIKANIPCRIAFAVSSQVDSRVILDTQGADKLLGRGDMLYLAPDQAKPVRIQGTFVADSDIHKLIEYLRGAGVVPQYQEEVTSMASRVSSSGGALGTDGKDPMFDDAVKIVSQFDRASASLLQRRLSVGYARAARILDQLEEAGIVANSLGSNSSKGREVVVSAAEEYLSKQSNPAS